MGSFMMSSKKNKKGRRQRRPLSAQRPGSLKRDPTREVERLDDLERLFDSLRSGAANVAGVTFQIATTVWVLAAGRNGSIAGLDV